MEIADYLRIARRRLLVLAGIPILAAAIAAVYVLTHPPPSGATVYVSAPLLMGSQEGTYQGFQGATQFANDFIATSTSQAVSDAVARQTDVSGEDFAAGLTVEQVGLSSQVKVKYTTPDSSAAGAVAVAVARRTLKGMFAPQVPIAQAAVDSAMASLHRANQALAEFTEKHGNLAGSRQNPAIAAQYADLLAEQEAMATTLGISHQVLYQARAQLAAANPGQARTPQVEDISLAQLIATTVVPAAAVGVLLALVLVALLELLAKRRLETTQERGVAGLPRDVAPETR